MPRHGLLEELKRHEAPHQAPVLLAQQGLPPDELPLVEGHDPVHPRLQRGGLFGDIVPIQEVGHLQAQEVPGAEADRLETRRTPPVEQVRPDPRRASWPRFFPVTHWRSDTAPSPATLSWPMWLTSMRRAAMRTA